MVPLSVLDAAPIVAGGDAARTFARSLDLARHVERLGYRRFWMAEHHSMPGIASAATSTILAYIGAGTSTIRIGAGGVMLPNHSPLVVAEQYGTLESLFPGRVDLGLGRAPGTDREAMRALRRHLDSNQDDFPAEVVELIGHFRAGEGRKVRAIPGEGLDIPVWILGSSLFGARLAAMLGLPYAFASHFAPAMLPDAIRLYRDSFQPSPQLERPYLMLGFNAFVADSDEEGQLLASSMQQAFVALRTGKADRLAPPVAGYADTLPPEALSMIDQVLSCAAIGAPGTARAAVEAFLHETEADELIVFSQIFDHQARLDSYARLIAALKD